jgi:hypothetical protein
MQGADIDGQRRSSRSFLLLRLFFELSLGAIGILALAAIAGPRLFDMHDNLALIAAVLVWLSCPVLLFLLGSDAARLWRRITRGTSS